jgi:hypothetical protein
LELWLLWKERIIERKIEYRKPKEKKAEQYSGILKLLRKKIILMISKLEGVSVSAVQRLKKEFRLWNLFGKR